MRSYSAKIEFLVSDLERDHGDCDENTCGVSVALRNGYTMHARCID